MARFSFQGNPLLSDEMFQEAMTSDKGIYECATATTYCDRFSKPIGKYVNYPSWEDVHDITDEQVSKAKEHFQRRRDELIGNLKKGDLAFVAMGGDYTSSFEDGVGNYRMRGDFCNSNGEQFFIEFCRMAKEESYFIDFSIYRQLEEKYNKECEELYEYNKDKPYGKRINRSIPQYQYNAKGVEKQMDLKIEATWSAVIKFINETYGCNYKTAKLFRYIVSPEDYVCHC